MARFLPLKAGTFRWGSPCGPRPGGRHRGGDVAAGDPKYVASPDGGYFELDIKTLRRSQFARRVSGAIMDRLR